MIYFNTNKLKHHIKIETISKYNEHQMILIYINKYKK